MTLDRKVELVKPWISDKRVLDLGCVDHTADHDKSPDWMHRRLIEYAGSVKGIDILQDEIETLAKRGYEVEWGDAQSLVLDEKFDVVFAGEIVEHIANLEGFLKSVGANLKDDGVLIVSTPNVFSAIHVLFALFNKRSCRDDHLCWFDRYTLSNLLQRHGFAVLDVRFVSTTTGREVVSAFRSHSVKKALFVLISYLVETILPPWIARGDMVAFARKKS